MVIYSVGQHAHLVTVLAKILLDDVELLDGGHRGKLGDRRAERFCRRRHELNEAGGLARGVLHVGRKPLSGLEGHGGHQVTRIASKPSKSPTPAS
jgi:hypothetical protein